MNKDWSEQKNHVWSIPSRPKCPLEEEEVKADETTKEKVEAEARTEEEEAAQKIQMKGAVIKIKTKAKAVANKVEKIKHMDKGNDKSKVQCHYCKKCGHYANECRKKQSDVGNRPSANFTK